jgi:ATP synthase protein I
MPMPGRYEGPIRAIGFVGGLGFMLAFSALLGAVVGHYLDQRWGTGPWLTLVGTLLGTAAGFYEIVSAVGRFGEGNGEKPRK